MLSYTGSATVYKQTIYTTSPLAFILSGKALTTSCSALDIENCTPDTTMTCTLPADEAAVDCTDNTGGKFKNVFKGSFHT